MLKVLIGHTSFDTAYIVDDYPYGFRLRCKIAYWIETSPKHGMRFVSRTTNPKKAGEVWNKPKASTYSPLLVMGLDDIGHVKSHGASLYSKLADLTVYLAAYADALTSDYAVRSAKLLTALATREAARDAARTAELAVAS